MTVVWIKEGLHGLGDIVAYKSALWGYLKSIQDKMHNMERIPKEIIDNYEKTICFIVDKDQCHMEAIEPRTV